MQQRVDRQVHITKLVIGFVMVDHKQWLLSEPALPVDTPGTLEVTHVDGDDKVIVTSFRHVADECIGTGEIGQVVGQRMNARYRGSLPKLQQCEPQGKCRPDGVTVGSWMGDEERTLTLQQYRRCLSQCCRRRYLSRTHGYCLPPSVGATTPRCAPHGRVRGHR